MNLSLPRRRSWMEAALFFAIAALLYLPMAGHTGYYDDDWYSMYAARVAGPQVFRQLYTLDGRPGRALVVIPLYLLFHGAPFYYSLSACFFRAIGAVTLLWLLRLIWPANHKETFLAALFFLIYPGFLSQPVAVDFQSHLVGIWMAFLSLGLGIRSMLVSDRAQRLLLWLGAVLSGWLYLAQMEYYIGFEAVRILLIGVLCLRQQNANWKRKISAISISWLPYAAVPFFFLAWRLLLFANQRKTTDIGLQLGKLVAIPAHTLLTWLIFFLQDIANVTLLAWVVPLSQLGFNLRLRDSMIALALSLLAAALFFYVFSVVSKKDDGEKIPASRFEVEAPWVGGAWVILGLISVTLGNRHVTFPEYSRYGLVSAGGAVILLVALLGRLSGRRLQRAAMGLLLVSATITHYANAVGFAAQMDDIRSFWWQVSWRVPYFEPDTTIVAHYPNGGIRSPAFVWGPANQIYYPAGVSASPIQAGIAAIVLDRDSVTDIIDKKGPSPSGALVETYPDPGHITIITQPSPGSCVQVIDGNAPEYSAYEDPMFLAVGPYSEISHIRTQGPFPNVPEYLLGAEPEHGWCYYYEKAALARQQGNWDEVLRLADEVSDKSLGPDDLIEWMPFLQAYALFGEANRLTSLSRAIQSDRYVAQQACQILNGMQGLTEVARSVIQSKYCGKP